MNRKLLVLFVSLTTLTSACQPQPEPPAASAPEPASPTVSTTTEVAPAAAAPAPANASDARAFAGRFSGGGTTVELRGDGTFRLQEAGAGFDGTWTAEENGTRVRLDPNSKSEADRLYAVAGTDLQPLDAEGKAASASATLHREAAR
ncbi:copper resistance protein NlpE N-terminal domain-containing protein [Lysobacter niastensis]|uniref:Copper resistance protein NlpE N-terminal domain-containing protein n=1 Tax=Lysobacter niastensis TaxID=380629 RepID=A0ABS0BBL0_9GAMM|nr:copper resistance protein NlpE N-terminal domain-containing protein [Lysobacter niastensis]MBF6024374.1 copper resistance protein NlpE N-terminal domain-containing protein [Lysobacter niastensis]